MNRREIMSERKEGERVCVCLGEKKVERERKKHRGGVERKD